MNWIQRFFSDNSNKINVPAENQEYRTADLSETARKEIVEKAAQDFAVRFEDVMKELAQG